MSRKDTIIITVLINTALLAVLLIIGLVTPEKVIDNPTLASSLQKPKEVPTVEFTPLLPDSKIETEQEVVYKLPELIPDRREMAIEVVVEKGDTLDLISQKYKTSVEKVIAFNDLKSPLLRIGQKINIPPQEQEIKAVTEVKKVEIAKVIPLPEVKKVETPKVVVASETKKVEVAKPKPVAEVKKVETPNFQEQQYYIVKIGDNPWTIALKHHIKLKNLLELNGLDQNSARKIKPGDKLRVR